MARVPSKSGGKGKNKLQYISNNQSQVSFSYKLHSLRKKCPHSDIFWSAFSRIRTEY